MGSFLSVEEYIFLGERLTQRATVHYCTMLYSAILHSFFDEGLRIVVHNWSLNGLKCISPRNENRSDIRPK